MQGFWEELEGEWSGEGIWVNDIVYMYVCIQQIF